MGRVFDRSGRVIGLLVWTAAIGAADLTLTINEMSGRGLFEVNAVAAFLARESGAVGLSALKLASLGVGLGLLYRLRAARSAEFGSWVVAAASAWLVVRWGLYLDAVSPLTAEDLRSLADTRALVRL